MFELWGIEFDLERIDAVGAGTILLALATSPSLGIRGEESSFGFDCLDSAGTISAIFSISFFCSSKAELSFSIWRCCSATRAFNSSRVSADGAIRSLETRCAVPAS